MRYPEDFEELVELLGRIDAVELVMWEGLDHLRRAIEELVVMPDTDPGTEGTQQQ